MKKILYTLLVATIISCSVDTNKGVFGDQNTTEEGKINGQELLVALSENDSVQVKVKQQLIVYAKRKDVGCM